MDLNSLVIFVRVVELGSFTQAAASLRCPKSRVSRRIVALEKELGTQLLLRTTRKLQPTEAGQALFEVARLSLADISEAVSAASSKAARHEGLVRVTAPNDIGQSLLWPIVATFVDDNPGISVDLELTNDVVDLVRTKTDIAIRLGRLKDSSLRRRFLGDVQLSVIASPTYIDRFGHPTSVEEFAERDVVSFRTGREHATWRLRRDEDSRSVRVHPRIFCNSTDVLVALVKQGVGISLLPEPYCMAALNAGAVVRVMPEWRPAPVPLQAVFVGSAHTPPRALVLLDYLENRLRQALSADGMASDVP